MKFLAVLLCMSGLAAVCLGQGTNSTTNSTVAPTTTSLPAVPPGTGGSATTPSAAGGGTTTTASAGGTTPSTYTCMNCTGDEASACGRGDGNTVTTTVTCDACWAYRDENTTSDEVTFIRGCAQESAHTCNDDSKNEQCNTAGDITRCWRCCTSADECNDSNLELLGQPSGAADVHVSVVVTMASTLCAIVALWQ
ncbi:uncharacterized protein LOC144882196 [Branchiostoma floridae x Branchiostoma japonicum]